jgi:tRNA-Thr(GGU) m(6)t(6)A37 methyltransferase TsaA
MELIQVGVVESSLRDLADAPKQGDEGAPDAWLVFEPWVADALDGIAVGDQLLVLTWLHQADRQVLRVGPRSDPTRSMRGVFSTRSPARPNPIGLHRITVLAIDGMRVRVSNLEAIDGTPVIDVKPELRGISDR